MQANTPVVLLTGASSGIGAAAVREFAKSGYSIVCCARRMERLNAVCNSVKKEFPSVEVVPMECNVDRDDQVAALFEFVTQRFGRLDAVVNNAGYGVYGSFEETSLDHFRANMETNYFGTIRVTKAALPLLRKSTHPRRSIILVSSIVGRRAMPYISAYAATKFAIEALAETLRSELSDERIAVSVINPGATSTDFEKSAAGPRPGTFIPLEQGMKPDAVAQAIVGAARKPVRNRYLTIPGIFCVLMQWLSPRFVDFVMVRIARKTREAMGKAR